jgi:lactoylglutathione lyase
MSDASMPRIRGLYETHLTVANLDVSIPFYRDVVGLTLAKRFDQRKSAFFWIDGKENGMLGLWETGSGPMHMHLHLAFRMSMAGVLASNAALRSKGVTPLGFRGTPVDEPDVLGWMPAVSQYFADPDGHNLEYIAVLDDAPDDAFGVGPYSQWLGRSQR